MKTPTKTLIFIRISVDIFSFIFPVRILGRAVPYQQLSSVPVINPARYQSSLLLYLVLLNLINNIYLFLVSHPPIVPPPPQFFRKPSRIAIPIKNKKKNIKILSDIVFMKTMR